MSWCWYEQGLDPTDASSLTMSALLALMDRYWKDVGQGWEPPVAPEQWVGPHHPWRARDT